MTTTRSIRQHHQTTQLSNAPRPSTKATAHNKPHFLKPLLAGGLMFSLIGILFELSGGKTLLNGQLAFASNATASNSASPILVKSCETEITETAKLSRQQLLQLLAVPERDHKNKIREIVQTPYCTLSSIDIRAGVAAEREAYPLAFDPKTTLVILYENDEYAGYRFKHY